MESSKLVAGIDEAGRGCVLGDLVVACVVIDSRVVERLQPKDSKKLSPKRRESLYKLIYEHATEITIVEVTAKQITEYQDSGLTLNQIETMAFGAALGALKSNPQTAFLDAADVNEERFGDEVRKESHFPNEIVSKHKGDDLFPVVSAASIIAKVTRDRQFNEITGSGYPSDPKTIKYLTEYYLKNKCFPENTRTNWSTIDKIKNKYSFN